jgi:hypothetical protein
MQRDFPWLFEIVSANFWLGGMKTDDDLLHAIARYVVESTGASEREIDLILHWFRTQFMERLKPKPAGFLTDEHYAEAFEQMNEEAAPFLQYLMTHEVGNLPVELRGEDVSQRAPESI